MGEPGRWPSSSMKLTKKLTPRASTPPQKARSPKNAPRRRGGIVLPTTSSQGIPPTPPDRQ